MYMYRILVYFGSELFSKNCSKIPFVTNPRGQSIGVAWQHFRKINFCNKAEKCEIRENALLP